MVETNEEEVMPIAFASIPEDLLQERAKRICPLVRVSIDEISDPITLSTLCGELCYAEKGDLRNDTFLKVPAEKRNFDFKEVYSQKTQKAYFMYGPEFRPTIAEALAQLPYELNKKAFAFEVITESPQPKENKANWPYFSAIIIWYLK